MRFIKLYEKITEWEWYDDVPTYRVFTHLLLTANWKPTKWHGIEIGRGQRLISFRGLAEETSLTEQQVRTAIAHLKSTHEITQESTHRYTIITVENYEKYQCSEKASNTPTNTQPNTASTSDIEIYRTIEDKEKNTTYSKRKSELPLRNQIPPTVEMVKEYCESRHNNINAEQFCDFYSSKNWMVGKTKMKDWQASVRTWERNHGRDNRNNPKSTRPASDITERERQSIEDWVARKRLQEL